MFNFKKMAIMKIGLISSLITLSSQSIAAPTITSAIEVGDTVELTVNNTDDFSVGALPFVLKIGDTTFKKSRAPSSGELNTLIFLIPSDTFNQLNEDDLVNLGYGGIEDDLADLNNSNTASTTKRTTLSQQKSSKQRDGSKRKWALGGLKKQQLLNKKNK